MINTGDSFINVVGEDDRKRPLEFMGRGYGIWLKFVLIAGAGWVVWKYVLKK